MQISLLSDNLQKKISFLNHAVSSRSQLPILSNFLLEAKDGKLTISATDLEIGISSSLTVSVEKEGSVTVPAKNFSDLLSNIGSQKITLSLEDSILKLKGDRIKASFPTSPAEDFPKLYEEKGEEVLTISREEAEKIFNKIVFAAAIDSSRPALSGILMENEKDGILFVATDGFRLSYHKTSLKTTTDLKKAIVVPARVIKELGFLKEEDDVVFYVSSENNQIMFAQKDTVLVGRLIDAEFPSYEKIIPTEFNTKTEFDREEMLNAIKICSVFARETANIVKLSIEKDKIVVSANTPSVGEDMVEIEAKTNGEENEIAFNAKYLLDVLSVLQIDNVAFEMTGPLNPGVFRIKEDKNFFHLVMPIRVQN